MTKTTININNLSKKYNMLKKLDKLSNNFTPISQKIVYSKKIKITSSLTLNIVVNNFYDKNYYLELSFNFLNIKDELDVLLFVPQNIIDKINEGFYKLIEKWFSKTALNNFFANDDIEKLKSISKDISKFYKTTFKNNEWISYFLEEISSKCFLWNFDDVLDIDLLENYSNNKVYHTIEINLKDNTKLLLDFYEIKDEQDWVFYFINPIYLDKNWETYNFKEYFPILFSYFLWLFEYRQYWVWYKNLVLKLNDYTNWIENIYIYQANLEIIKVYDKISEFAKTYI